MRPKYILFLSVELCLGVCLLSCSEASAEEHYQSGKRYFEEEQYEKARIELMNALRQDNSSLSAHLLAARTAQKLGIIKMPYWDSGK